MTNNIVFLLNQLNQQFLTNYKSSKTRDFTTSTNFKSLLSYKLLSLLDYICTPLPPLHKLLFLLLPDLAIARFFLLEHIDKIYCQSQLTITSSKAICSRNNFAKTWKYICINIEFNSNDEKQSHIEIQKTTRSQPVNESLNTKLTSSVISRNAKLD